MKYINFKGYKFSTILKDINFKRYSFSKIYKYINLKRFKSSLVYISGFVVLFIKYIFSSIYKYIDVKRYKPFKIYKLKLLDIRRYKLSKIYQIIDLSKIYKIIDLSKIYKIIDFKRYVYFPIYVTIFFVFSILIYLNIPLFFNYDKSEIEKKICGDHNIKCSIQGEIKYSFLPSPRIQLKKFIIKDLAGETFFLASIERVAIKVSLYNLTNRKKLNFNEIKLENAKINIDLKKYKNFLKENFNSKPISLEKSEIKLFDGKKDIATIRNVNIKYKPQKNSEEAILKGHFLNDDIYISFKNKKNQNNPSKIFVFKLLNSYAKINVLNTDLEKNIASGNISFKNNKNRIKADFDYKENQIFFKQANLRNAFLDGRFNGDVKFLPYFNFNLDVELKTINFNKLYSSLIALDEKNKKNLFKINEKINGQLNLSADKIFSKKTLIDSLESQIKFMNGNILVEQLLLNLGKLGAADLTGTIKNDKKFTTFKFENNIFIDNLKRFYNKFGIFNKQDASSGLFIAGSFDLANLRLRLNEISNEEEFKDEDIAYIEKEFNNLVLEEGYASLFDFIIFKEFVQLISTEDN